MSKGNRKAAEDHLLTYMEGLTLGGYNRVVYENLFKRFNNGQFEEFVNSVAEGNPLSVWYSNFDKEEMLDWGKLLKLCEVYGYEPHQNLIVYDSDTGARTITPVKFIAGQTEVRKQRQHLFKKFSASKDDSQVDDLTGQVINRSQAASLSAPEVGVLLELGLTKTTHELYNVKGGDNGALKAYKNDLISTGKTTTIGSMQQGTGVKSLRTVQSFLRGRMLDNNYGDNT